MKVTQKEFNHGATRTKAAKQAKGEYVIFIVQDAVPKDTRLFAHMISFLQQNKDTAAVSVMQTPKADADVFAKWQTEFTYESLYFDTHDFILRKPEGTAFTHLPLLVRRQICFLDDVCCAVKKDVFFELGGFPRIPISEDTWFAKEAVNTGYGIGFIGSKSVTHSHTRPAEYFLKRSYIGFKTQLGLFEMPVETPFATFQELMDSFATVLKSEDLTELALVEQLKERLDVTSLQELDPDEIDNEFAMTISGMRLQTKKLSREDKKELYLKVYASLLGKHIAQYVLVHEDAEMEAICDELLAANV